MVDYGVVNNVRGMPVALLVVSSPLTIMVFMDDRPDRIDSNKYIVVGPA